MLIHSLFEPAATQQIFNHKAPKSTKKGFKEFYFKPCDLCVLRGDKKMPLKDQKRIGRGKIR